MGQPAIQPEFEEFLDVVVQRQSGKKFILLKEHRQGFFETIDPCGTISNHKQDDFEQEILSIPESTYSKELTPQQLVAQEKLDKVNHDAQVIHLFGQPAVDQPRKRKETGLDQAPKDPFYQKLPFKG